MHFRPLLVMTLAAAPALGLLIALGVWQLERAEEKRAEIATYASNLAETAKVGHPLCAPVDFALGLETDAPETTVGEEVRFFGRSRAGAPGWRILKLAPAPECAGPDSMLVTQVAFEPTGGEREARPVMLTLAAPPRGNAFTPQNDTERGEYYRFEPQALAEAFGIEDAGFATDVWLIDAPPGPPERLTAMPPARHIGYALTWFGLAATLVGVYLAYHVRAGRLGRSGSSPPSDAQS